MEKNAMVRPTIASPEASHPSISLDARLRRSQQIDLLAHISIDPLDTSNHCFK